MSAEQALRLRRTDEESGCILIHVKPHGTRPLDLKLVASEGEHVYPASIKDSNVKVLQASNYAGNLDQWKAVLRYALLRVRPEEFPLPDNLQGVETVCSLADSTLTIVIRKNIGGIHQRLGSIRLPQNDEEVVDAFHMAAISAAKIDTLLERMDGLQASAIEHQAEVAKLTKQLDDLVQAKKDHESEMLRKCAALINAKKLKIRDQQRLLVGARLNVVDEEALNEVRSAKGRDVPISRGSKRKANGHALPLAEKEDDDGQATDDQDATLEVEEGRDQQTPEPSENGAFTESDEGGFDVPPARAVTRRHATNELEKSSQSAFSKPISSTMEDVVPPSKRELPFTNNADPKRGAAAVTRQIVVDDEDETDDEEL
ncbi:hypothetical protein LTR62_004713 [Meristemomyces frigidus]|uniref:Uncharacterized protein n=1 Tax=Meristemomyces frigidus TaxID=1508187 RepID=A0AAN7YFZ1_9PEZI|nr:hypothetical protein LTR62_004713 [Meristemomyces frigidus]